MKDFKEIEDFILNNKVEFSNNRIDIKTLDEYIESFNLEVGNELKRYILEYGFLKFDNTQFYGIDNIEKKESSLIKQTLYLQKNYPREIKNLINFGKLQNGNILLVDSNDMVYCWKNVNSIKDTGIKFFDYILNLFTETELLSRHDEEWKEKFSKAKIIWQFKKFDKKYLNDKEIAIEAVKNDGDSLEYVEETLKNDKNVVIEAVKNKGNSLKFAGETLKNDKDVIIEAICQNINAFEFVDMKFKEDDNFMKDAIIICKGGLKYASEKLKNDRDFVINLVKVNGTELAYAGKELQYDKEVVLYAINQNISAFLYAKNEEIQDNIEYVKKLLKEDERYFMRLSEKWRDNEEIVSLVVSVYGELLEFASNRLKDNKEIALKAINCKCKDMYFGRGLTPKRPFDFLSERLQKDTEIIQATNNNNGWY